MSRFISNLLPAVLLLASTGLALAQQPAQIDWTKAVPEASFKAPRLGNDSAWLLKTPRIAGNSTHKEQQWGVFDYTFDTLAPWTDNVVVNYYILLDSERVKDKEKDMPRFTFMQLTMRYGDIPKGKDHRVSAVVLPVALQRYGFITALGFEMQVQDRPVYADQQFATGSVLLPTMKKALENNPKTKVKWWEIPNIVNNPQTFKREGYLLDRSKTPFSVVAVDDYLMSK